MEDKAAGSATKKLHKKKEAKKALLQAGGGSETKRPVVIAAKKLVASKASFAPPRVLHQDLPHARAAIAAPTSPLVAAAKDGLTGGKKKGGKAHIADEPYRTLVLTDVCADLRNIYARTLKTLLPNLQKQIPLPTVVEEADGAIVMMEVDSRAVAEQIFRRTQNAHVFGRRLKTEFHDSDVLRCANVPVLVDVRLSAPTTCAAVSKLLSTIQGFLAVASADGFRTGEDEALSRNMIATFADEGSSLHARAVLSGRTLGGSTTHMFLSRR